MLDVYMDEKMLTEWVRKYNHRNDRIGSKIREFIRYNSNLFFDKRMNASGYYSQILTTFSQNAKDSPKPKFAEINESLSKSAKCWSIFLFNNNNQTISGVKNSFITANESELEKVLSKLLFIREGQQTVFSLVPNHKKDKIGDKSNLFEGWRSLSGDKLIPFSDIVILDPYFLEPYYLEGRDIEYLLEEHINKCLIPLIKTLSNYSINGRLNLTVFSENKKNKSFYKAKTISDSIISFINSNSIKINFTLIVSKNLEEHKRGFYTNYFGLNPGVSINVIHDNSFLGNSDEMHVSPYSEETSNNKVHKSNLDALNLLYQILHDDEPPNIFPKQRPENVVNSLLTDASEFCNPINHI